jgi:hypothetical protein
MNLNKNDFLLLIFLIIVIYPISLHGQQNKVLVSTYYFGGWAGHNSNCSTWDKNAPTHATEKLEKHFSGRKPIWGWRDDSNAIMRKQINLASQNGIDCFFFDWYWSDNNSTINKNAIDANPLHDCIKRFMSAKNNNKMKFAMMIANHSGFEIKGKDNWISLVDYMSSHYFNHKSYLKFDGKPVIAVFSPKDMFPYVKEMKNEAMRKGFPGLYIIALGEHNNPDVDAVGWYNIREAETGVSTERKYEDFTHYIERCWYKNPRLYPVVMSGWDQRPWNNQNNTLYYTGRTPKLFGEHLSKAYEFLDNCTLSHKLIMIYAWNELGEGGYIVPCKEDPKGLYLKEVRKVKQKYQKLNK